MARNGDLNLSRSLSLHSPTSVLSFRNGLSRTNFRVSCYSPRMFPFPFLSPLISLLTQYKTVLNSLLFLPSQRYAGNRLDLTPCSKTLFERPLGRRRRITPHGWNSNIYYCVWICLPPESILSHINPLYIASSYYSDIYFNIISH